MSKCAWNLEAVDRKTYRKPNPNVFFVYSSSSSSWSKKWMIVISSSSSSSSPKICSKYWPKICLISVSNMTLKTWPRRANLKDGWKTSTRMTRKRTKRRKPKLLDHVKYTVLGKVPCRKSGWGVPRIQRQRWANGKQRSCPRRRQNPAMARFWMNKIELTAL